MGLSLSIGHISPRGTLKRGAEQARSYEMKRQLVPQLAAQRAEIMQRLKEERRAFLRAYYEALGRWRAGERDAEFPWGTWWLRVFHGAKVAAAPPG